MLNERKGRRKMGGAGMTEDAVRGRCMKEGRASNEK